MDYKNDNRIVLTLDAGGTNFVFSAMQGYETVGDSISLPANGSDLDASVNTIIKGFEIIKKTLKTKPSAISFAFPGPADYPKGIIGDLGNLPAYRGGVPLGPILYNHFQLPVFINNDGDLFTCGEAIAGFLPYINNLLLKAGNSKRYKNLIGLTLGTGFGGGIVIDNKLLSGDNSAAAEVWLLRNFNDPKMNAEEGISIRAVKRFYAENCRIPVGDSPEPKEIFEIASGRLPGNSRAGVVAFYKMGEILGEAIAGALTLIDGLVVIGGGIAAASSFFMPAVCEVLNSDFIFNESRIKRLESVSSNLEDTISLNKFLKGSEIEQSFPGLNEKYIYDPVKRTGVGITKLGTSKAVSIGAYVFALSSLDGN